METQIESEPVAQVREWAINKIELLHDADRSLMSGLIFQKEWKNLIIFV